MSEDPTPEKDPAKAEELFEQLAKQSRDAQQQLVKNGHAVGQLAAEVRSLTRRYDQQQRGLALHSIGVLVLFSLLSIGGFYWIYRARSDRAELEHGTLKREKAELEARVQQLQEEDQKRQQAQQRAMQFYQRLQRGDRRQALAQYAELADLSLSPVETALFSDWVKRSQGDLAYAAYAEGMRAVKEQDWKRAEEQLRAALKVDPNPAYAPSLHYHLGIARLQLGSYQDAARALEQALSVDAERLVSPQVRYHLATAYELLGNLQKARQTYAEFLLRHPSGPRSGLARRRLKDLSRR